MGEKPNVSLVSNEERRRRLSRVILELATGEPVYGTEVTDEERSATAEKKAERGAAMASRVLVQPTLRELLKQKPVFYENDKECVKEIVFEPEFVDLATSPDLAALLADPTKYIENNLLPVSRGAHTDKALPSGAQIEELVANPYDVSKVRILKVNGKKFIVKRVDKNKVTYDLAEFDMMKQAREHDIPSPQPVGYIKERGNTYLIIEYIEDARDLNEFRLSYQNGRETLKSHQELNKSFLFILSFNPAQEMRLDLLPNDMRWQKERNKFEIEDEAYVLFKRFLLHIKELTASKKLRASKVWLNELNKLKNKDIKGGCHRLASVLGDPELSGEMVESLVFERIKEWSGVDLRAPELAGDIVAGSVLDRLVAAVRAEFAGKTEEEVLAGIYEQNLKFSDEQCEKFTPIVEREYWGASISVPLRRLYEKIRRLSKSGKLHHKDLALRNIVMKVDKNNRPIPDENGDAQFFVIDWEQY